MEREQGFQESGREGFGRTESEVAEGFGTDRDEGADDQPMEQSGAGDYGGEEGVTGSRDLREPEDAA